MRLLFILLTVFLALSPRVAVPPASAHDPEEIPGLVDRVIDAVVTISTAQTMTGRQDSPSAPPNVPEGSPFDEFFEKFFEGQRPGDGQEGAQQATAAGAGFVVDPSGLIVTSAHIIKDAEQIAVTFSDGSTLQVDRIVGRDAKTDLAVLKVSPKRPLMTVKFGDSSRLRIGQVIVAIGSPFGLGGSVTSGIISALHRDVGSGVPGGYIQTDAALNRGNAGGPLFDLEGEVVGINAAIVSPTGASTGVGLAIPANTAAPVIDQLKRTGEVRRGWLGVHIQRVTHDVAASLNMQSPTGALVADVTPGGPADKGGIEAGDVILAFDGREVSETDELPPLVANTEIGKRVAVQVLRNGKTRALTILIERLPATPAQAASRERPADTPQPLAVLDVTLESLSPETRASFGIVQGVDGVAITDVQPGSAAAQKGLARGQVVVSVAGDTVATPADVSRRVGALRDTGRRTALLLVDNGKREKRFVALPLTAPPPAGRLDQEGVAPQGVAEADIAEVQRALTALGYDPGPVDGAMGARTRDAIAAFQRDHNIRGPAEPTVALLRALHAAAPDRGTAQGSPPANALGDLDLIE